MTFVNPCGSSIIMAPICTRCRKIIEDDVYIEPCKVAICRMRNGECLEREDFVLHPDKCPYCGAVFQHIVYPGRQTNPYNVNDVLKTFGKELVVKSNE